MDNILMAMIVEPIPLIDVIVDEINNPDKIINAKIPMGITITKDSRSSPSSGNVFKYLKPM